MCKIYACEVENINTYYTDYVQMNQHGLLYNHVLTAVGILVTLVSLEERSTKKELCQENFYQVAETFHFALTLMGFHYLNHPRLSCGQFGWR